MPSADPVAEFRADWLPHVTDDASGTHVVKAYLRPEDVLARPAIQQ